VWMVVEKSMPDGEEGRGCSNCTPHLGQVLRVGAFVSNLDISHCPKLEVKPYLPLSLQHLELYRSNEKLLQLPCECSGSASSFFGFSHLKKLLLQGITRNVNFRTAVTLELIQLPDCFRGLKSLQFLEVSDCSAIRMLHESLGELQSLQELTIRNCNSLTTLPQSMGHLTSLRSLILDSCSAISLLPESLGELHSLQELTVQSCRSLSSLPQSVVRLTSLLVLRISCCDAFHEFPERLGELRSLRRFHIGGSRGLACLPESMCGLTSLEDLSIWECPSIKSLPEGIKGLTSLRYLSIWGCPDLKRRCESGTGEDWHLVSHIPNLVGDWRMPPSASSGEFVIPISLCRFTVEHVS
jgi:structure-specific endonuclease subunit SLX1